MAKKCESKLYLVHVWGDVEPRLKGPYKTDTERVREARRLWHRDAGECVVARLNVTCSGKPVIGSFSGREMRD